MLESVLGWLAGESGTAIVAGALGGLVRWLTLRPPWRDGLYGVLVGAICALYLGPVGVPLVEAVFGRIVDDPAKQAGLTSFIIGSGGTGFATFITDVVLARLSPPKARSRRKGTGNVDPG